MPLDGHSYLVAQGWSGKGNGLRKGAISKPITVNQKKTLAGLGKDRDEAFPFWDHLFSAASKAITVKIDDSDASDSDEVAPKLAPVLHRTTTGILSNRRPANIASTSASTSTSGPSTPEPSSLGSRLSLLAIAKREAAKRNLYSRFYRGAVLAPESCVPDPVALASSSKVAPTEHTEVSDKKDRKQKRKAEVLEEAEDLEESKAERKRRKKEAKEMKAKEKLEKKMRKEALRESEASRKKDKEERRRLKAAKREAKLKAKDEDVPVSIAEAQDQVLKPKDKRKAL